MKKTRQLAGIFLAAVLFAVCAALLLFIAFRAGRAVIALNRNDALSDSPGAADDGVMPVLNPALLSLIGSDNAALQESYSGHCYAELTQRGAFRLTYFSPYLSVQFAPESGSGGGWPEGYADGYYEENPLADDLRIRRIDLCEEIDPKVPALLGQQDSLRQLIQTDEPITYDLLCALLEQTPELSHKKNVFYDAGYITDDPAARSADGQRLHQADQRVNGGEEVAVFVADNVEITIGFIRAEEEYLAYYARMEKANG